MIKFNKPHLTGKELQYIAEAAASGKLSGNGPFTKRCQRFLEGRYGFRKALLTTSCTDALEMAAILLDLKPGDEVIVPSYTFVSTALAFVREGAVIRFVDSLADQPNLDHTKIEGLVNERTKAIVVVHYAGVACNMSPIMEVAERHGLFVVEDAAQAIESYYSPAGGAARPLGSIGHLAAFSFHETKNVIAGEGGLLAINDRRFVERSEIIWEKGTNRAQFFRGEIDKYGWVDRGSSFLASDLTAAFLFAQLSDIEDIQRQRLAHWQAYDAAFRQLAIPGVGLPVIPDYATNNAHMYYLVCDSGSTRQRLIAGLRDNKIKAVFHYLSLHASRFYTGRHDGRSLPNSDRYTETLVRLPMYYDLTAGVIERIAEQTALAVSR